MSLAWISESDSLPEVGQVVLLATPRTYERHWDIKSMCILIAHEGVIPQPVGPRDRRPTDYYWGSPRIRTGSVLITGLAYWASMTGLDLPPGAAHESDGRYDYIVQT